MKIKITFRCYDCPKHTGVNGTFETLNEALEHIQEYRHHIIYPLAEVSEDE